MGDLPSAVCRILAGKMGLSFLVDISAAMLCFTGNGATATAADDGDNAVMAEERRVLLTTDESSVCVMPPTVPPDISCTYAPTHTPIVCVQSWGALSY